MADLHPRHVKFADVVINRVLTSPKGGGVTRCPSQHYLDELPKSPLFAESDLAKAEKYISGQRNATHWIADSHTY